MFSLYYQWLGHFCKTTKFRPPPKSMAELQGLFSRVLRTGLGEYKTERRPTLAYDDDRAADFRSHFRLWFGGRPWNQISIEDVRAWLAWSMFDQPVEDLRHKHLAGHLEAIEETLAALIDRTGGGLSGEPKRLGTVITLTWDKVNIWSRPAALYLFSESWNQLALYRLRWCYGLEKGSYRGIEYVEQAIGPTRLTLGMAVVTYSARAVGTTNAPLVLLSSFSTASGSESPNIRGASPFSCNPFRCRSPSSSPCSPTYPIRYSIHTILPLYRSRNG